MLGTGLRIGECLALRVQDLDLDAQIQTLTVTGTVVRANGRLTRQAKPKSDSSRRTITLPTFVVAAIRTAIDLSLDGADDLVFPSTKGSPRSPGRVRDQLREAQQGTGIDVTPHDFNRTVATQVARGTTLATKRLCSGTRMRAPRRGTTCSGSTWPRTSESTSLWRRRRRRPSRTARRSEKGSSGNDEGPHNRVFMRVGPFDWR